MASASSGVAIFLFFDKIQLVNLHPALANEKSSSKAKPKSPYLLSRKSVNGYTIN